MLDVLKEILKILREHSISISPIPLFKDGIGYEFSLVNHDKCVSQYFLKLIIINEDLMTAYSLQSKINDALITLGDERKGLLIGVKQSGGSVSYDDELQKYKLRATYVVAAKG